MSSLSSLRDSRAWAASIEIDIIPSISWMLWSKLGRLNYALQNLILEIFEKRRKLNFDA